MRPRYLLLTCLVACGVLVAFFTPTATDRTDPTNHSEDISRGEGRRGAGGQPGHVGTPRSGSLSRTPAARADAGRALNRGELNRDAAGYEAGLGVGAGVGGVVFDPDADSGMTNTIIYPSNSSSTTSTQN